jgi:hypothetical protein
MNEPQKPKFIPKQRLEIANVELDVKYAEGTKFLDRIFVQNLSLVEGDPLAGKNIRMTIFRDELKTFVRGKTVIIADIEEKERPGSQYGPDRTIVQVYDEQGEPVLKKKQGGGGGGYQRRSLEDDITLEMVKRVSIEGQTSIAQVGAAMIANVISPNAGLTEEDWKRIFEKYWRAVEKGLDNYLAESPLKVFQQNASFGPVKQNVQKPAMARPSNPTVTPLKGQQPPAKAAPVAKATPAPAAMPAPIQHVGDLLTRSAKLNPPVSREILCVALNVNDPKEIKDLELAWQTAQQISASKSKNKPVTAVGSTEEEWGKLDRNKIKA